MKKRVLSLLLALLLVLTLFPSGTATVHAETVSGKCGANLNWSLNTATGALTITGSGPMWDFSPGNEAPWEDEFSITSLSLPSGLTTIGNFAFSYSYYLTSVTIPNNVTRIGESAFESCDELKTVVIGSKVTKIGNSAFAFCSALSSVTVGSSVSDIGDCAFSYCSNLKSISFPSSVTRIGCYAFDNCIGLTGVTIPAGVSDLDDTAFNHCDSLKKFTVNAGNPNYSIDSQGALYNKDKSELHRVPGGFEGVYSLPDSVTFVGFSALEGCGKLTKIQVGSGNPSYRSDSQGALYEKDMLTLLKVPGGMQGSFTVPGTVSCLKFSSFAECSSLTSVSIPNSVTEIGYSAFSKCTSLASVTIPNSVTEIQDDAFIDCSSLASVTLSNHLAAIPPYMFFGCSSLTSVSIPNSVTSIGRGAFYNCSSLSNVTIGTGVSSIEEDAFIDCSKLTSIVIPASVTDISLYAVGYYHDEDWEYATVPGFTIYGTAGSAAQTYANENAITFKTAAKPSITTHPKNTAVAKGGTATFKVVASGTGLSYQWQYKKVGESGWTNWSGKTAASVSCTAGTSNNGCQYRCVVKNSAGSVTSSIATLTTVINAPAITTQPKSVSVAKGGTATFKVVASGEALSYQWQYKKVSESSWTNWSGKTAASVSCTAGVSNNGCQYRCVVKNVLGSVTSSIAILTTVSDVPTITTQPKNTAVAKGSTATFKVVASGSNLTYQWQYKKVGESGWTNWSGKTAATVTCTAGTSNNGCQYRCVVKNSAGSVTSSIATLTTVINAPAITTQPKSVSVAKGGTATFKVVASGEALSYQWQYKKVSESSWTNWSGKTAASVSCTAGTSNNGCQYRCVVKNAKGSVTSSIAILTTVSAAPTITTQPKNTSVAQGNIASFLVIASGTGLSYQWQYKKVGQTSWTNWSGKTAASVTCTAGVSNNGCQYRCVVKNAAGSVTSSIAVLTTIMP